MFAARYFTLRYWATRFWPKVGSDAPVTEPAMVVVARLSDYRANRVGDYGAQRLSDYRAVRIHP